MLPCRLSENQIADRAREAGAAWSELKDATKILTETMKNLRDVVKDAKASFAKLMDAIASGVEERAVTCEDRPDWDAKQVLTIRLDRDIEDDDLVIERRPMTDKELQAPLGFDVVGEGESSTDDGEPSQSEGEPTSA